MYQMCYFMGTSRLFKYVETLVSPVFLTSRAMSHVHIFPCKFRCQNFKAEEAQLVSKKKRKKKKKNGGGFFLRERRRRRGEENSSPFLLQNRTFLQTTWAPLILERQGEGTLEARFDSQQGIHSPDEIHRLVRFRQLQFRQRKEERKNLASQCKE